MNISTLAGSALRRLDLYRRVNLVSRMRIGGASFAVPLVAGLRSRVSELWMLDVLKVVLAARPGAVLDVGANLGQTLLKLRAVDPDRSYFGFEPNPACVAYLEHLVAANRFAGVTIFPAGVSDTAALIRLQMYGGAGDPSASVVAGFRGDSSVRATKFVPLVPLGEFESLIPPDPALIKIDVEGAELEVMTTFAPLLETARPYILLEVLPAYGEGNTARIDRQQAIESLVRSLDYRIHRILRRADGRFDRIDPVPDFGVHGDLDMCDYLLAPSETAGAISVLLGTG